MLSILLTHKKMCLFILLCCIIIFCIYSLIKEIGHSPDNEELKKYKNRKYFYNERFHNIFKPIYDFKIANPDENNTTSINIFKILIKRYKKPKKKQIKWIKLKKTDFKSSKDDFSFYWLGHSSLILNISGKRIAVDPVLDNASPLPIFMQRWHKSPIKRKDLSAIEIDMVVLTHNHYDHLERKTILALKNCYFIVPLGIKTLLTHWGINENNITELGWDDKYENDSIIINAEPSLHFSQRWLTDGNKTLWNSYVIQGKKNGLNTKEKQIFIAGDGGFGEQIYYIANKYKNKHFDLVAIEIDAWNIRWKEFHMFPREVVEVAKVLKANYLLPVHYGVFPLGMHEYGTSLNMLLKTANNEKLNSKVLTPAMGEKVCLD